MRVMIGLFLLPLAGAAHAADTVDRIRAVISDSGGADAPGCAVGIFRGGKTQLVVATGSANVSARRPIDGDTQFYLASVSKQFTVLALAQLVVAGKLKLDDDVRKWLPELPEYRAPVTIAMLVHHTAGIRDFLALEDFAGYATPGIVTRAEALHLVLRQSDTNFTPGTQFTYSNGGYLLLSRIVERAAEMPFAEYVQKNILKPLGMTRTVVLSGTRPSGPGVADGYVPEKEGFAVRNTHPRFGGAGGMMTTVNDLARYDRDIDRGRKVWTPDIARIMLEPGRYANGAPAERPDIGALYGGALLIGKDWFYHSGGAEGFKTFYARASASRTGVALLCNRSDWSPQKKAAEIAALYDASLPSLAAPAPAVPSLGGRYVSDDLEVAYELAAENERLTVTVRPFSGRVAGTAPMEMIRVEPGVYRSVDGNVRLVFDDDAHGFTIGSERATGIRFQRADSEK